jgi:hypothetical protein
MLHNLHPRYKTSLLLYVCLLCFRQYIVQPIPLVLFLRCISTNWYNSLQDMVKLKIHTGKMKTEYNYFQYEKI